MYDERTSWNSGTHPLYIKNLSHKINIKSHIFLNSKYFYFFSLLAIKDERKTLTNVKVI